MISFGTLNHIKMNCKIIFSLSKVCTFLMGMYLSLNIILLVAEDAETGEIILTQNQICRICIAD